MQLADPTGSVGATLPKGHLLLATMHSDRLAGKTETFVRFGATRRLEIGFGYLWEQDVVRPLASYTLVTERNGRPAITSGLFFDALGGGREAVFASVSRSLQRPPALPVSAYLGIAHVTNEEDLRFIAGGSVALMRGLNASVQYDGRTSHLGLTGHVGSVGGLPVYLGVVLTAGTALGPIAAVDVPLTRAK